MFVNGKFNVIQDFIFSKLMYQFNVISIRFAAGFLFSIEIYLGKTIQTLIFGVLLLNCEWQMKLLKCFQNSLYK